MKNRSTTFRLLFGAWGLYMMYFGVSEPLSRLLIDIDGTVIESQTKCAKLNNNRCVTTYTLQPSNSSAPITYKAGYTDKALSRYIKIGANIEKQKWQLGYYVNGRLREDFPITFYTIISSLAFIIFVQGVLAIPKFLRDRSLQS